MDDEFTLRGAVMELPDFLNRLPDGEIVLTGHRVGLYHLVQYYNEGESAEMSASRYPTVPLALVHKVIAFYLDHQPEVNAYVGACVAALDQQRGDARRLEMSALRQRLAAGPQPATTAQHPI